MEQAHEEKKKRERRNKIQLEDRLFDAIDKIIESEGFIKLKINLVAEQSGVIKRSIYANYEEFENLLETYYCANDFTDTIDFTKLSKKYNQPHDYFKEVLKEVYATLSKNPRYQNLVRWEVARPNIFIRDRAEQHEKRFYAPLVKHKKEFEQGDIDIEVYYALLLAGIYYLVLRRDVSPFCQLDLTTIEGPKRLNRTISQIGELLHMKMQQEERTTGIIQRLRQKGLSDAEIAEVLETDEETVARLPRP